RPCIGHRTGYSLHENARISGLASADFEGVFAHSYKRWRPRLFLRALRKEPKLIAGESHRPRAPLSTTTHAFVLLAGRLPNAVGVTLGHAQKVRHAVRCSRQP